MPPMGVEYARRDGRRPDFGIVCAKTSANEQRARRHGRRTRGMVLFILVYFVAAVAAELAEQPAALSGSKIEMYPDGKLQYLQFDDVSYNITDFTICSWMKLTNFSNTQTIFRLTGSKNETVILWRVHARPKESMRVTIKNRLVASESSRLARGQWNHVCFQWKGLTGVWAMFVNAKIHSVGQVPAGENDTMSSVAWNLQGKGYGTVGDDRTPCRNGWLAYGLYMAGTAAASATRNGTAAASATRNGTAAASATRNGTTATAGAPGRTKNASKRQAVFDSDPDDPTADAPPRPFQWLTKSFTFIKRMFTIVIVPFFKFVRNTFFQTRSLDDTVVDVSETHLTVSEVKFEPHSVPATTASSATAPAPSDTSDDLADDGGGNGRRTSSSANQETIGRGRCDDRAWSHDGGVEPDDLLATGATDAKRYLRIISDGLNDVGVDVALVTRAFTCCDGPAERPGDVVLIDWNRTRARPHNVAVSPHVCRRS